MQWPTVDWNAVESLSIELFKPRGAGEVPTIRQVLARVQAVLYLGHLEHSSSRVVDATDPKRSRETWKVLWKPGKLLPFERAPYSPSRPVLIQGKSHLSPTNTVSGGETPASAPATVIGRFDDEYDLLYRGLSQPEGNLIEGPPSPLPSPYTTSSSLRKPPVRPPHQQNPSLATTSLGRGTHGSQSQERKASNNLEVPPTAYANSVGYGFSPADGMLNEFHKRTLSVGEFSVAGSEGEGNPDEYDMVGDSEGDDAELVTQM